MVRRHEPCSMTEAFSQKQQMDEQNRLCKPGKNSLESRRNSNNNKQTAEEDGTNLESGDYTPNRDCMFGYVNLSFLLQDETHKACMHTHLSAIIFSNTQKYAVGSKDSTSTVTCALIIDGSPSEARLHYSSWGKFNN